MAKNEGAKEAAAIPVPMDDDDELLEKEGTEQQGA